MKTSPEAVIKAAHRTLEELEPPKLWLTARGLAGRLRKREGLRSLSQVDLYNLLAEHAEHGRPRLIRNSRSPSARTLEVLWGAVSKVSEMVVEPPRKTPDTYEEVMADLYGRRAAVVDGDAIAEADSAPDFFLSYNFNDSAAAADVAQILERKNYSVWIAGACIAAHAIINDAVRNAMAKAGGMLLYLSSSSLRSLWVAKEQLVGEALPRHIIVKGDDGDLIGLVHHWIEGGDDAERANDFGGLLQVDAVSFNVAASFREQLRRHVVNPAFPIYMHPPLDGCNERLVPLEWFPEANPSAPPAR
jgi:hypothetical protein